MPTQNRSQHTTLYSFVQPLDSSVPVHLFTAVENAQGAVLCNVDAKLVLLNLSEGSDVPSALELVEVALGEMQALDTGTLVLDTRFGASVAGTAVDVAVRVRALESGLVTHLGLLTTCMSCDNEPSEIERLLQESHVQVVRAASFSELTRLLSGQNMTFARLFAGAPAPTDFAANYGASMFSLPELGATVIRTSGDWRSSTHFHELMQSALLIHRWNKASVLILDTSDSAPFVDYDADQAARDARAILRGAFGLASTLVHVHLDEVVRGADEGSFAQACATRGVFGCEVSTLPEALTWVRILRGCRTKEEINVPVFSLPDFAAPVPAPKSVILVQLKTSYNVDAKAF